MGVAVWVSRGSARWASPLSRGGADQSQQRRHGEMDVAWWVWPCGCRVGLRDGPRRSREVAASRCGQQQDFKLLPRALAASLTAWAAANFKSLPSDSFFFFEKPVTLSCSAFFSLFFFFSFVFPFGLRKQAAGFTFLD